ncbi:MAG: ATP-binding protein [Pseudomonadota bacterium]
MKQYSDSLDSSNLPSTVKEHINRFEKIRRDFVANVSHELRTPLTVIHGYLEILCQKSNNEEPIGKFKEIFEQMYAHSVRMEHIINELLLLSRLESEDNPAHKKEAIHVSEILEALCEDAKRVSGNRGHVICLEDDRNLLLSGAEDELRSLFSNIIINAVKYTPAGGRIAVKWYVDDNEAVFSVTDTGMGIEQKHIPRLTERFYRVDKARSRESGGTGLGLAIVKHVLMRHQGEMTIESEPGEGSTFTCRFPYFSR